MSNDSPARTGLVSDQIIISELVDPTLAHPVLDVYVNRPIEHHYGPISHCVHYCLNQTHVALIAHQKESKQYFPFFFFFFQLHV